MNQWRWLWVKWLERVREQMDWNSRDGRRVKERERDNIGVDRGKKKRQRKELLGLSEGISTSVHQPSCWQKQNCARWHSSPPAGLINHIHSHTKAVPLTSQNTHTLTHTHTHTHTQENLHTNSPGPLSPVITYEVKSSLFIEEKAKYKVFRYDMVFSNGSDVIRKDEEKIKEGNKCLKAFW